MPIKVEIVDEQTVAFSDEKKEVEKEDVMKKDDDDKENEPQEKQTSSSNETKEEPVESAEGVEKVEKLNTCEKNAKENDRENEDEVDLGVGTRQEQRKKAEETTKEGEAANMEDDEVLHTARTSRRICGSAASSSDSETADDAPLLPDEGPSRAVRIDVPGGDKPISPHDRFPKQPFKALISFGTLFVAAMCNTITLSYVHEHYPNGTLPLPDIIFDNFPIYREGLGYCEKLMILSFASVIVLIVFHRHRYIVFRRLCTIGAILYFLRCITMLVTQVPLADPEWPCAPRLGDNATIGGIVLRGVKAMLGLGLNVSGNQTLCGDYIYSGHTLVLVVSALFMGEYSPRRWWILHMLSWFVALVGVVFLILSHGHYTLDVILSYFICTRVFWLYHTLAANPTLQSSTHNHHTKEFWFWWFRWMESDIHRPVPRRFDAPFPINVAIRWLTTPRARRNSRHAIE